MKPTIRKFDGWTRRMRPVCGRDRVREIGDARAIRGADLAQSGPALPEDLRNSKRAADLHQLPAAHQDLAPFGESVDGEKHGRGVVVDHHGSLGREHGLEPSLRVGLAMPAVALREVELEIGVRRRDGGHMSGDFGREGRAAEVGVNDHPGGVDDAFEGVSGRVIARDRDSRVDGLEGALESRRVFLRRQGSQDGDLLLHHPLHDLASPRGDGGLHGRAFQKLRDLGNAAAKILVGRHGQGRSRDLSGGAIDRGSAARPVRRQRRCRNPTRSKFANRATSRRRSFISATRASMRSL